MTIKPLHGLFAVCSPEGQLMPRTVREDSKRSIDAFMEIGKEINAIAVGTRLVQRLAAQCCPSWEGLEAQGYRVVQVSLAAE